MLVTRQPKPVADYTGLRITSCTCPQRLGSSPGDDVAAQGANPRVAPFHTYPRAGRATYLVVPEIEGPKTVIGVTVERLSKLWS